MSRIILKKYDNGEHQYVVGWDRPCDSYFWQVFNKEPEVAESGEGKWQVTSPAHNEPRVYDTQEEAAEHKWDEWEEMIAYKGYWQKELPTMKSFVDSLPAQLRPLVTDDVQRVLREHSQNPPDVGSILVDMTKSNVVMGSYKVEVLVIGETKWSSNSIRFATEQEAEQAAIDLAGRWTMVQKWRVARSTDAPNYKWEDGKAVTVNA